MHCLPHHDAATSLIASSSKWSWIQFLQHQEFNCQNKGPCVFEIPAGGCGLFGKFLPHTYTIRMFGRGMGKSHRREEKGNVGIVSVKHRRPLEEDTDQPEEGR